MVKCCVQDCSWTTHCEHLLLSFSLYCCKVYVKEVFALFVLLLFQRLSKIVE